MTIVLDPHVSEFETVEQEEAHTAWIQSELERRRLNPGPLVPHDEVFRRLEERLAGLQQRKGHA